MEIPEIIEGGNHTDSRGTITFFNEFDMREVKRFYVIENANVEIKRAWRGHKIEQRWFNVLNGAFKVQLVKIDNWEMPDKNLSFTEFLLSAEDIKVLHIPVGYASSVQATQSNSKLIVFADYGLDHALEDDYLYPENYFSLQHKNTH